MSTRRRLERKREPGTRTHSRWRKRLGLACRADHWRDLWAGRTFEDFRRPIYHDARVAWLVARCPKHRTNVAVSVVVSRVEEHSIRADELRPMLQRKIDDGARALWLHVAPSSVRRYQPLPEVSP